MTSTTTNPPVYFCRACVSQTVAEAGSYCRTCEEHSLHLPEDRTAPGIGYHLLIAVLVFVVVLAIADRLK